MKKKIARIILICLYKPEVILKRISTCLSRPPKNPIIRTIAVFTIGIIPIVMMLFPYFLGLTGAFFLGIFASFVLIVIGFIIECFGGMVLD